MKRWGRPISPYPYARRRSEGGTSVVGEEDAAQQEGEERQGDEVLQQEDEDTRQQEGDGQAPLRSPSPVSGPRQDLGEDRQQEEDELHEEVRRASTSRKASTSVTPAAPRSTTTPAAPPPGTPNQHLRSILRARSRSRTPGPSAMAAATPFTTREPSLPPLPESSPAVHQGGLMEALEAHRPREAASGMEDVNHGQETPHQSHDMDRGDGMSEQTSVTPPESVAAQEPPPRDSTELRPQQGRMRAEMTRALQEIAVLRRAAEPPPYWDSRREEWEATGDVIELIGRRLWKPKVGPY